MSKKTYLGDGLYAHDDGWHIVLSTARENGEHYVALEPEVVSEFMHFLEKSRGLDIRVAKRKAEAEPI